MASEPTEEEQLEAMFQAAYEAGTDIQVRIKEAGADAFKDAALIKAMADLSEEDAIEYQKLLKTIKGLNTGINIDFIKDLVKDYIKKNRNKPVNRAVPTIPKDIMDEVEDIIGKGQAYEYIYGIWQERVKGNALLGKALLVSRGVQSCLNTKGIHVYAHGKHGHGKSEGMEKMIELLPSEFRMDEDVSPLAIHYASQNGMLLPGTTLLIDEMIWTDSLGGIIKRVITKFQKGAGHLTVIDGESVLVRTQPRLTIWTNSADLQADEQLRDRFLDFAIEEGQDHVAAIIEFQKRRDTLPDAAEDVDRENTICQTILRDLANKTFTVNIPYAQRIRIQSSEGTRGYNIFSDLVKGLAALRYEERDTNEKEELLADEDDFRDAKNLYQGLKGHAAERYGTAEARVLQAIIDHGYKALIKDIKDITGMSEGRIKDIVNGRGKDEQKRHGLRYKCPRLDVNTVDISVPLSGDDRSRVTTHPIEYSLPRDFQLNNGLTELVYLDPEDHPDVERRNPDVDPDVVTNNNSNNTDVADVVKEEREGEKDKRSDLLPSFPQKGQNPTSTTSPLNPIAKSVTSASTSPYVSYVGVYVLADVPTFSGVDGINYTLNKDDVADLPKIHADNLIRRGVARAVIQDSTIDADLQRIAHLQQEKEDRFRTPIRGEGEAQA